MYAQPELEEDRTKEELLDLWRELADDPDYSNQWLEITENGEIVVSPLPTPRHQAVAQAVARQLEAQLGGATFQHVAVFTATAGIRGPDVIWMPADDAPDMMVDEPMDRLPALVVEVLSPSNRKSEMAHKIRGYLASGVQEVIVIALDGKVTFHRADGVHEESAMGVKLDLPAKLFARQE